MTEGITEALDMVDITLRVRSIKYQSQQLNPEEMHVSYAVKLSAKHMDFDMLYNF